MSDRNHRKYKLKNPDGTVIRSGITSRPLKVREQELRREENNKRATIHQEGRATTKEAARVWEDRQKTGTPPGGNRRRK